MRNLILLIVKYGATILFVILEFICFYLIINYNQGQKEIWLHSANLFSGKINQQVNSVKDYVNLQNVNDSLHQENARLLQTIINYRIFDSDNSFAAFETQEDTLDYQLIPARIIDKTVHLRNNYISIDKGIGDGLKPGMGVISSNGVVGIVNKCSEEFCQVMLLLNSQSRISAKIRSKGYSGTLTWRNKDSRRLNLDFIPKYADLSVGDTIETSGFSSSFPEGIFIGRVDYFKEQLGSHDLDVELLVQDDLASLSRVYIVDYLYKEEKEELINEE